MQDSETENSSNTAKVALTLLRVSSKIFPVATQREFFCACSACSEILLLHHTSLCMVEVALDISTEINLK